MAQALQTSHVPNISALAAMDRAALLEHWRLIFRTPPPRRLSSAFLRRFLAFEMQARDRGGLPRGFEGRLSARKRSDAKTAARALTPGTRLLREWNGVTHTVEVTEEGYLWNGETYRSLSAIARAITGARWSGPRFFGLNGKAAR